MTETSALEAWGCSAGCLGAGSLKLQSSRQGAAELEAWRLMSMIGKWMIGNGFDDTSRSNTLDALREVGGFWDNDEWSLYKIALVPITSSFNAKQQRCIQHFGSAIQVTF